MSLPRYVLSRITISAKDYIELSEQEYKEIIAARDVLFSITSLEEKFITICEAYKSVEQAIFSISLDHLVYSHIATPKLHAIGSVFGRQAMFMLSVVRLYLDSVETHASEISSGRIPREEIKAIRAKHYDGCFEYRLMEAVRNHAQHRAFPVHDGRIGSTWNNDRTVSSYGVTFAFLSKDARKDGKFKRSVLDELDEMGGKIELKQCIRRYFSEISSIHMEVRKKLAPYRDEVLKKLEHWRERWEARSNKEDSDLGFGGVAAWKVDTETLETEGNFAYIDPQVDEYREEMEAQTRSLTNMFRRRVDLYRAGAVVPRS